MSRTLFEVGAALVVACALGVTRPSASPEKAPTPLARQVTRIHVNIPPQTLETNASIASAIVRGSVIGSRNGQSDGGQVTTIHTLAVSEWIKSEGASVVEIEVLGGSSVSRLTLVDRAPVFREGEDALFFLWKGPESARFGILGLDAGVLTTSTDAKGAVVFHGPSLGGPASLEDVKFRIKTAAGK